MVAHDPSSPYIPFGDRDTGNSEQHGQHGMNNSDNNLNTISTEVEMGSMKNCDINEDKKTVNLITAKEEKDTMKETNDTSTSSVCNNFLWKCMGSDAKPPPCSNFEQSFTTFIGAFLALLSLSLFYAWVRKISDGKYNILLAPFGALVTLQFGLVSVPPAQPRAAIYAELIALPVSILCNSIPHNILPSEIEIALAPAIGIGVMQYFGLTHPPAGASCIVFSKLDYSWGHMLLFEVGVFICIFWSMVVNNLNAKRQYPAYWYLWPKVNYD